MLTRRGACREAETGRGRWASVQVGNESGKPCATWRRCAVQCWRTLPGLARLMASASRRQRAAGSGSSGQGLTSSQVPPTSTRSHWLAAEYSRMYESSTRAWMSPCCMWGSVRSGWATNMCGVRREATETAAAAAGADAAVGTDAQAPRTWLSQPGHQPLDWSAPTPDGRPHGRHQPLG